MKQWGLFLIIGFLLTQLDIVIAELRLTVDTPSIITGGTEIRYAIQYQNSGSSILPHVNIQTALLSGISYISGSLELTSSGINASGATSLSRTIGTLLPGQTGNITFTGYTSGSRISGTILPLIVTGFSNSSEGIILDGINNYISIPNSGVNFIDSNANFTTSLIVSLQSFNNSMIIYFPYRFGFFINGSSQIRFRADDGGSEYRNNFYSFNFTTNTIYHIVYALERGATSGAKLFINNTLIGEQTGSNHTIGDMGVQQNTLGYRTLNPYAYSKATYYDFKLFNKALNSSEVSELYTTSGSQMPITASGNIVLDYRFYDRSGSKITDYSSYSYIGTLINFSNLTPGPLNSRIDRRGLPYSGDNTQDNYLATTSGLSIYQTHSDLGIILSGITSSYRGGSQISFDLIYNNSGRDSTTGVIVLSRSTGISFGSSSMTGVLAGDTITYTGLFLTKNQTGSIQIALNSLLIGSGSSAEWLSTSIIGSDQDLHTTNNYTTQYTTIKKTDLIISQQVTGLYLSGGNIYYTLHYYNNSPQDLSNITITNQLSEHITLVNTTPSYTTYAANTITRSGINLSAYTTGTITITGIIISGTIGTSILNIASITDTIHGDINNSNNISSSLTSLGNGPSDTRIQLENNTSLLLSGTSAGAGFQYGYANTLVANQEFGLSMLMGVGTTAIPGGYQYYFFTNSASGPTFIIANYGDSGLTTNNTLQVFLFGRGGWFSTSYQFPPQGTNVHIIISFKNDILKLYINGVFHSQYYKPGSFVQQGNAGGGYNNIKGSYKSIKFFGSGLTDQQVTDLYLSENKKYIGSELSYWNFDTISGNNIQDSIGTNTTTINPSLTYLTTRSTGDIKLLTGTSGGNSLSYPLYIGNYGPYRATGVTISTTLASGLSYASYSLTGFTGTFSSQIISGNTVLSRSNITLAPYQTGLIIVTGFVQSRTHTSGGQLLVKVSGDMLSTSVDTYTTNNTTDYTRTYLPQSDLRLSVTPSGGSISGGQPITYTISYTNSGRDSTTGAAIVFSRQTGLQFISSSLPGSVSGTNQYQRTGLSLQKNQTGLITLTLLALTGGAGSQTIGWTGSIIGQNLDPDYSDTIITGSTEIIVPADLRIIKSVNTGIIYQGDTIIYTIDYGNSGHQTAKGVLISDNVLSGIQISNTSITPARSGSNHFERDITTLSPGQTGRIIITGSIIGSRTDGTQITNTALIRQDGGLRFDGIDDYISLPSSISQLLQDTVQYNKNFSFSFWIYITPNYNNSNGQGGIFFGNNNANYNGLDTRGVNIGSFGQNYISFYIVNMNNPGSIGGRYSIPLGLGLHQFSFVHTSNSHLDIYSNGTLVATTPTTLNTTINYLTDISPRLGFYPFAGTNYRQKGNIYDFKIFNKSLTSGEVRNLYMTQGSTIPSSAVESILADWRFNDMYGQLLSDRGTNNLTGVLTNYTIADTTLGSTNKRVDSTLNPLITPFSEEQNSANNASTVETTFFIRPDLWISGNAILSAYALNDTISYQILYGNSGGTTTGVTTPTFTITSTIASGIQYISALPAPTTQTINSIGETILTRSGLIMTGGWSGSIILTGQVIQSFAPVSNNILHLLSISTGRGEIITGNNTRSIATIYTPTADISIALSPTIISGLLDTQIIQHLISWINLGPDVSGPLSLTLNRGSGYVYITGSQIGTIYATGGSWVLPSIGSGQTGSITITGMIATGINPTITPTIPLSGSILPTIQDRQLDNNIISGTLILAPSLRNIVNRYQNRGSSSQQEGGKIAIYSGLQLITGISFQQNEGGLTILSGELFNNLSGLFTVIVEGESSLIVAKQQLSIQPGNIMIDFRTGSTLGGVFTNTVQGNLTKKGDLVKGISVAEGRNYINSLDLQVLLNHIGNPSLAYNSQYDLNNDGGINAADVSILIGNFYQQGYGRPYDYNF